MYVSNDMLFHPQQLIKPLVSQSPNLTLSFWCVFADVNEFLGDINSISPDRGQYKMQHHGGAIEINFDWTLSRDNVDIDAKTVFQITVEGTKRNAKQGNFNANSEVGTIRKSTNLLIR